MRLLHVKLQQGQTSAAAFAELPECRRLIATLVQLFQTAPASNPVDLFPLDVSASTAIQIGRPPLNLIQPVMQAQMTGLVLGVLIQLALADIHDLAEHMQATGGLQLLHTIALVRIRPTHPELQDVSVVKQMRPDVHEKLLQVYRQVRTGVLHVVHAFLQSPKFSMRNQLRNHYMASTRIGLSTLQQLPYVISNGIAAVPCH